MKPLVEKILHYPSESFAVRLFEPYQICDFNYWHFHPEYEIVYIHNGRGTRRIGNHTGHYQDGELLLLGPNIPHFPLGNTDFDDNFEIVIQFSAEFITEQILTIKELSQLRPLLERCKKGISFDSATHKKVGNYIRQITEESGIRRIITLIETLNDLAQSNDYELLNDQNFPRKSEREHQRINKIYHSIMLNYKSPLSLDALAEEVGLTKNSLCRYFKSMTGKTVLEFLNEFRVAKVKEELKEGLTVSEAMYSNGFNDPSHFSRLFKKKTGKSPTQYKRSLI